MNTNLIFLLLVGALVGGASAYLGSFMVIKRMALVGDALSHVALPGIAIALSFGVNPMIGAFVALTLAVAGVWYLGEKSEIYPEALVGIFFTASLAAGILITPEPELLEALFGNIDKITGFDGTIIVFSTLLIFVITALISKRILLSTISPELAKAQGISVSRVSLIYLFLVGLVVALGVKFLGTLLTGALVIVPAAASKNVARSMFSFQIMSVVFGVLSSIIGIYLAGILTIPSGPAIVLASVLLFVISLLGR